MLSTTFGSAVAVVVSLAISACAELTHAYDAGPSQQGDTLQAIHHHVPRLVDQDFHSADHGVIGALSDRALSALCWQSSSLRSKATRHRRLPRTSWLCALLAMAESHDRVSHWPHLAICTHCGSTRRVWCKLLARMIRRVRASEQVARGDLSRAREGLGRRRDHV